jgi:hypothetical protein
MKVKFIIIMLVAIVMAACSSPKKDAEKVCKCLESVIELSKDEANEEAMIFPVFRTFLQHPLNCLIVNM